MHRFLCQEVDCAAAAAAVLITNLLREIAIIQSLLHRPYRLHYVALALRSCNFLRIECITNHVECTVCLRHAYVLHGVKEFGIRRSDGTCTVGECGATNLVK